MALLLALLSKEPKPGRLNFLSGAPLPLCGMLLVPQSATPLSPRRRACDHLAGQYLTFWPQKLAQEQPWDPPEFSLGISVDTGGLIHP